MTSLADVTDAPEATRGLVDAAWRSENTCAMVRVVYKRDLLSELESLAALKEFQDLEILLCTGYA